jgi:uncharacterized protein (TIGR03085 family)
MPTPAVPVSQSERAALADLLAELGPDQPTCCEGWTTAHLAAHLVVRDRRPDATPGFVVGGALAAWSHRLEDRTRASREYGDLVADVRSGPARWWPTAWPAVDRAMNTAEMTIHHEDVRRAQPAWSPRDLPREVQDQLWSGVALFARGPGARRPGGLTLRRTDVPAGTAGAERRVRPGEPMVTVAGAPLEVLLWLSGRRDVARVDVTGA